MSIGRIDVNDEPALNRRAKLSQDRLFFHHEILFLQESFGPGFAGVFCREKVSPLSRAQCAKHCATHKGETIDASASPHGVPAESFPLCAKARIGDIPDKHDS